MFVSILRNAQFGKFCYCFKRVRNMDMIEKDRHLTLLTHYMFDIYI